MPPFVRVNTKAPAPLMIAAAALRFNRLRQIVFENSGVDFLSRCGDVFRTSSFRGSKKDGVARQSWHNIGRAFDYDQTNRSLIIVPELVEQSQYFRTYLLCAEQTGRLGKRLELADYRDYLVDAYVFDFTAAAEALGFKRIPALDGWVKPSGYNRREFWHYQYNPEGISLIAAIRRLGLGRT